MNRQHHISVAVLSLVAELASGYVIYNLLGQWLQFPDYQVLTLGELVGLGLGAMIFNLLLIKAMSRPMLIGTINLLAGFLVSYLLLTWLQPEGLSLAGFIGVLHADLQVAIPVWALLFLVSMAFFRAGSLCNRPISYQQAIRRFEAGMGVIFTGLLLVNLASVSALPAVLAAGLALTANVGVLAFTRFQSRQLAGGWLALLIYGVVIAASGWLVSLLLPYLTGVSRWLWGAITPTLGGWAQTLVKKVFEKGRISPDTAAPIDQGTNEFGSGAGPMTPGTAPPEWLQQFFMAFSWVLMVGLVLIILGLLIFLLTRLWYRRNPTWFLEHAGGDSQRLAVKIVNRLIRWFMSLSLWIKPWRIGEMEVRDIYHGLLIWGNLKRHPRQPQETPLEYGLSLSEIYPRHRQHIILLTESFTDWRYGNKMPTADNLKQMQTALRHLYIH